MKTFIKVSLFIYFAVVFLFQTQAQTGAVRPKQEPKKSASLTVFFFRGDPDYYNLVQNAQVNLQHCIDGYDKSVLLKEDMKTVGQTKPTKLLKPNMEVFLNQIIELTKEGYYIDIYLFMHGNDDDILFDNDKNLTTAYLKSKLAQSVTGYSEYPIRIVYQMNCYGRTFNQTWLDLGAISVCGAREVNYYPNQFNGFAKDWKKGNIGFAKAVYDSNTESSRSVMQALIQVDAAKDIAPKKWDKCPIGRSVLGDHDCAKSYFTNVWGIEWQAGKDGKENMNYSSYMFTPGNDDLTWNNKSLLSWNK